jgi:predicted Fe-Mo cluster-binding NifX family protein
MKIAVASDNKVQIANHFGRTRGFLIYEVHAGSIKEKTYIENNFTGHAQGHAHHHDHGLDHEHGHHHSHHGILNALNECEVVISRGMGRRLLDDLAAAGKNVYITWTGEADEAVNLFLEGNLEHDPEKSCQH